jgi:hypothetical protein
MRRAMIGALGAAALAALAAVVWPARVLPPAGAQAPDFGFASAGAVDRSALEPGAERTLGLRWRFARVQ